MNNYIEIKIPAKSKNEALARNIVGAFCVELNPTVDELDDVKTAVSEAVTNCIVHAYTNKEGGEIKISAKIIENSVHIEIEDYGIGIDNIADALKPFYTTKLDDERSGMGFTIMQSFMDEMNVFVNEFGGTTVQLIKNF